MRFGSALPYCPPNRKSGLALNVNRLNAHFRVRLFSSSFSFSLHLRGPEYLHQQQPSKWSRRERTSTTSPHPPAIASHIIIADGDEEHQRRDDVRQRLNGTSLHTLNRVTNKLSPAAETRRAAATSSPSDAATARDAPPRTRRSRDSPSATWLSLLLFVRPLPLLASLDHSLTIIYR